MVFPYFFCFPNFYRSPPLHSPQKRSQKLWHCGTSKPKRLKTPAVLKKGIGSLKMGGRLAGYSYEYHWKILKIGWILFSVGLTQKWCWLKCFNQQDFFWFNHQNGFVPEDPEVHHIPHWNCECIPMLGQNPNNVRVKDWARHGYETRGISVGIWM